MLMCCYTLVLQWPLFNNHKTSQIQIFCTIYIVQNDCSEKAEKGSYEKGAVTNYVINPRGNPWIPGYKLIIQRSLVFMIAA